MHTMCAVQATAGSDGRVLLFDTAIFKAASSGVASPAAAQQVAPPGAAFSGLHWLAGGCTGSMTRGGATRT